MKIFKSYDGTNPVDELAFSRTVKCLSKVNWNRTKDCNNHLEYHGYSDGNMVKAINSRHPMIYSHYQLSFSHKDNRAYLENNNSSSWMIVFDSHKECKDFKKLIFNKFFNTAKQKKNNKTKNL